MTKPSVHLALATLRDVLEAFEEKKRQRQKNKSGKEKDLSKVRLRCEKYKYCTVLTVFGRTF